MNLMLYLFQLWSNFFKSNIRSLTARISNDLKALKAIFDGYQQLESFKIVNYYNWEYYLNNGEFF